MYSLLIADDNPVERSYLHSFIAAHFPNDFTIVGEASDGHEALELSQKSPVDVYLLDIQMPKLDGLETAEHLRTQFHDATIVFITSHADFAYAQKAVRLGVSDYLLKPYVDEDLVEMLQKLLVSLDKGQLATPGVNAVQQPDLDFLAKQQLLNTIVEDNEAWHSAKILFTEQPTPRDACKALVLFPCAKNSAEPQAVSILQGIFSKRNLHCLIWTRQAEVVVFLFGDKARDFQELEASIQRSRLFLQDATGQNVYSGVSSFYTNTLALRDAYLEAVSYMGQFGPQSLAMGFEKNKERVATLLHLEKLMVYSLLSRKKQDLEKTLHEYLSLASDDLTFKYLSYVLITAVLGILGKKQALRDEIDASFLHLDTLGSVQEKQSYLLVMAEAMTQELGENGAYHNMHLVKKAIMLIQKNYQQGITLMDIATELQVSYSHLSKCFTQVTGTSFNAFLLETRMQAVMGLMKQPIASIADLGKQVGIEDPYYFSKSFKKFTGLSPSEYLSLISLTSPHSSPL